MKEIWKDIKGYEKFYQVSNFGRVKSLQRKHYYPKKDVVKEIKKQQEVFCGGMNNASCCYVV